MSTRGEDLECRTHDGLRLPYRVTGSGPVLLMANGLAAGSTVWNDLAGRLADRYRCITWDYRGMRAGPAAAADPRTHAADAQSILNTEGVDSATIVGWSMGTQVALELLRVDPARVAALVFINGAGRTAWGSRPEASIVSRGLARALPWTDRARWATGLIGQWLVSPEARSWASRVGLLDGIAAGALDDALGSMEAIDVDRYIATLRLLVEHDATDMLDAVRVPALFIAGDRDPFCSRHAVERCVNRIADAEYLVLPGGTHFVLLERPDHVSLRVAKFLEEHDIGLPG